MLLTRLHVTIVLATIIHSCTSSFVSPNFGGGSESGLTLSDVTQRKSGSEYVALDKGRTSKAGNHGFDKDESGSRGQQEDSGRYSNQENNQKGFDVGRKSSGDAQSYNRGENNYEQHGSGQHKKGYHKSGFTNNYHKDESADKASFYEDSEDERGHRGFDNKGGYYGQRAEDAFRDGRYDGAFTGRNKDHQGHYDNRDGYDNRRGHAGSYDDNRYYDDRRNYLHDGLDKAYDRNGNEMYYRREQPYRSHAYYSPAPLVSGPLYSKDYLDAPPPRYYPSRRDYHRGDYVYPEKGISHDDSYVDRGSYRGGVGHRGGGGFEHGGANYGNSYGGARYNKGHQPSDYQDGFRRSY